MKILPNWKSVIHTVLAIDEFFRQTTCKLNYFCFKIYSVKTFLLKKTNSSYRFLQWCTKYELTKICYIFIWNRHWPRKIADLEAMGSYMEPFTKWNFHFGWKIKNCSTLGSAPDLSFEFIVELWWILRYLECIEYEEIKFECKFQNIKILNFWTICSNSQNSVHKYSIYSSSSITYQFDFTRYLAK